MSITHRLDGNCPLTPAELQVLELLMEGKSYDEIAETIGRATSTVRTQLHTAYRRLGVATSYQAVLECVRAGWLCWSDEDPESAILLRIEELMRQLVDAVQVSGRSELTVAQRHYLERLEEHLHSDGDLERRTTRAEMDGALATMLRDADPDDDTPEDLNRDLIGTLGQLVDRQVGSGAA